MPTNTQLKTKIVQLENCLKEMAPEHEARGSVISDLRALKQELENLEDTRTFERDTFDIMNHNFYPAK